ncbi:hypothetical protein BD324DRAFT_412943 [Kockovaella imperatae]|uniref:Uncharacterized protein n=1 Tax=Kockovaella imperatae TaxID=4999 RepID=A0A1Y1UJ43_9TREE|nr:hypothetical protein BD324DRAFT_412943 [Kockovaella imperatae]ORX37989.1 hypothetical protein BD324DRAFT_412943 [Kockovaella imperatae]
MNGIKCSVSCPVLGVFLATHSFSRITERYQLRATQPRNTYRQPNTHHIISHRKNTGAMSEGSSDEEAQRFVANYPLGSSPGLGPVTNESSVGASPATSEVGERASEASETSDVPVTRSTVQITEPEQGYTSSASSNQASHQGDEEALLSRSRRGQDENVLSPLAAHGCASQAVSQGDDSETDGSYASGVDNRFSVVREGRTQVAKPSPSSENPGSDSESGHEHFEDAHEQLVSRPEYGKRRGSSVSLLTNSTSRLLKARRPSERSLLTDSRSA